MSITPQRRVQSCVLLVTNETKCIQSSNPWVKSTFFRLGSALFYLFFSQRVHFLDCAIICFVFISIVFGQICGTTLQWHLQYTRAARSICFQTGFLMILCGWVHNDKWTTNTGLKQNFFTRFLTNMRFHFPQLLTSSCLLDTQIKLVSVTIDTIASTIYYFFKLPTIQKRTYSYLNQIAREKYPSKKNFFLWESMNIFCTFRFY